MYQYVCDDLYRDALFDFSQEIYMNVLLMLKQEIPAWVWFTDILNICDLNVHVGL